MSSAYYLSLLIGPTVPLPAPQAVVDALTGAQVTVSTDGRSGFQLTFSVANRSMLTTTLLPAGYFDPLIRVILIVTVRGTPSVLMDGVITRHELSASNEPGRSTLTVTGEDLSVLMDMLEVQLPAAPGSTATTVLSVLARYAVFGIVPLVVPELFPFVTVPVDKIRFQSGTDLAYVRAAAQQNGYVFYLDPGPAPGMNVAYWGPEIRIGIPQSALNVGMDAHTNVESLTFSLDGTSREQQAVFIPVPGLKLAIPVPIPDVSLLRPPLALKQAPAVRYKPRDDVAHLTTPQAISLALAEQARSADAVTASGTLDVLRYGRPLHARRLVGVRGAGITYDGLYFVKSVTHTLERGSYRQSFMLARNGLISLFPRVAA